jgi:hypothetical protein
MMIGMDLTADDPLAVATVTATQTGDIEALTNLLTHTSRPGTLKR